MLRFKVILGIVVTLLFFVILEAGLRIANFDFDLPKHCAFAKHFGIDAQLANGTFLKDPVRFWKLAPYNFPGANSKGFRDREFTIKKPKDIFRIICLGDSVTAGYPFILNKIEDSYPKRLEFLLNSRIPKFKFEVINAGVPGYSSYQGMKYLDTELIKYQPDLLVVHFGVDDQAESMNCSDKDQIVSSAGIINFENFLCKSRFFLFLEKLIFVARHKFFNFSYSRSGDMRRVPPGDYLKNMEEMKKYAEKHHVAIIFVTPMLYQNGKLFFREKYRFPEGVTTVDLFSVFKDRKLLDLFFDDCHLTPKGNDLVAVAIADTIFKERLITNGELI